jgi:hypothetical protein
VRVWNTRSGAQDATWPARHAVAGQSGGSRGGNRSGGSGLGAGAGGVTALVCDAERAFVGDRSGSVRVFALAPHLRGAS